jgi:hypothetical protein
VRERESQGERARERVVGVVEREGGGREGVEREGRKGSGGEGEGRRTSPFMAMASVKALSASSKSVALK